MRSLYQSFVYLLKLTAHLGLYTLLFAQAICMYRPTCTSVECEKNALIKYPIGKLYTKGNAKLYSCALSIQWILVIVGFWHESTFTRSAFVLNNNSPVTIISNLMEVPNPCWDILPVATILISDSILVRIGFQARHDPTSSLTNRYGVVICCGEVDYS